MTETFDIIIGLEVHVQLKTKSKLFCRCSTQFGQPPNTQTCPVCTGSPGALPVMNREAFALSLRTAVALNCEIPEFTKWDRKQYYYPDLPKGYQISQFDLPMSQHGFLAISHPRGEFPSKKVGIIRAHLEEDAGKSMHDEAAGKADSRIDLNRTGTPLLEIVSEPDMRSAAEARAYLDELKLLLGYIDVSDCNMQEGSLRVDANINLHVDTAEGKNATPIVEIKNMNSFRAVERAMEFEAQRQWRIWQEKRIELGPGEGEKTTRGWDDQNEVTRLQREKEDSADYRYFPDPDLMPVEVTPADVERVRGALCELPAALRTRLATQYKIDAYDADVIVNQGRAVANYYMDVADKCGDGKLASNWIQQGVLRNLKEMEIGIEDFPVTSDRLAELLKLLQSELDSTRAKDVFAEMLAKSCSAREAMKSLGIEKVDAGELESLCQALLAKNPQIVEDLKNGKLKAVGAIIGQARQQNPNANPNDVRAVCLKLVEQM